jgi:hypothetical protein
MKLLRSACVAFTSLFLAAIVFAADPSGSWKWTISPPNGDPIEISAKLELKDGKLTGTYQSPFGEAPISKGVFKDNAIAFEVERERDGNKFVIKYAGKLDGDAIKGTYDLPAFDGNERPKQEWNAKRVK